GLEPGIYRISVVVNLRTLGTLDIQLSGEDGANIGTRVGATGPIRFRIEERATTLLPASSEPLIQAARALLTSPDPLRDFSALQTRIYALYEQFGIAEGARQMEAVGALAYNPE